MSHNLKCFGGVQKDPDVFSWCLFLSKKKLGGGFKDFFFTPILGEDEPILTTNMFQMGWFKTTKPEIFVEEDQHFYKSSCRNLYF